VDVGHDTSAGYGYGAEQTGELLVVADGELDVARHDTGLLVVPRSVPGELENLQGARQKSRRLVKKFRVVSIASRSKSTPRNR
jgi:hypothetical protein